MMSYDILKCYKVSHAAILSDVAQSLSWAMRGAKRLAEYFALAKHSSEDYYRRGQNYFRSGYLSDIG